MKRILGTFIAVLGLALLLGAGWLFAQNQQEQQQAAQAVAQVMPQLAAAISQRQATAPTEQLLQEDPLRQPLPQVQIDGHSYIGFVGIPALQLELPVMSDWTYPQLRKAPCRFTGDICSEDLVIMAHNYAHHFGNLGDLKEGDTVTFTSMEGKTTYYQVVAKDILERTDVEEMTAGAFDLTLFTCTYGGQTRLTIRCDERPQP